MERLIGHPKLIAVIGNHLPRQCGIATFTTDLCNALARELPSSESVIALAMDDVPGGYRYPDRVGFEIRDNMPAEYLRAAEYLNVKEIEIGILQHEYGIYGGQCGANIFQLLENLRIPILTTLHTVLPDPKADERAILLKLGKLSERLIVMSQVARGILMDVYQIPEDKIAVIPHGIPDVPFVDSFFYKDQFGLEGRKVILTFGLLSPGKGLETMIDAMVHVVERHPEAIYVILGATHPHILRDTGEKYRHELQQQAHFLGLENHVLFYNQFLDLQSLLRFISTADVFVTPYPSKSQIVSGTLSYAMGAGKAVVSTPYLYAEEQLADGRGILVPFDDPEAMGKAVGDLLSSDSLSNSIRKEAYQYCRPMVWKEVARNYLSLAQECIDRQEQKPKARYGEAKIPKLDTLPKINLDHLRVMTDDTGMLQHAHFSIPNRDHGYCTDDNARALIAVSMYYKLRNDESVIPLIKNYLSFLISAFNQDNGRFRNFMSYDRKWLDAAGSEDSHGRALWGLGMTMGITADPSIREGICHLFENATNCVEEFEHPRAWAFAIIGIQQYLSVYGGDSPVRRTRTALAEKLYQLFKKNSSKDWPWFADTVTCANARLPQALLAAARALSNEEMLRAGLESLTWLLKQQTAKEGHISIIGNNGWMHRSGQRAHFGQQPLEAMGLIEACAEAFLATKEDSWLNEARRCLAWFLGGNDLNLPIYDFKTGGCHDGLEPQGLNRNMGAESTLAWLISLLTMYNVFEQEILLKEETGGEVKA